jgi:RND family efflux transporter MFP subunit
MYNYMTMWLYNKAVRLLAASTLLCVGCQRQHEEPARQLPPPVRLQVGEVAQITRSAAIVVSGTVRPHNRASLAARYAGTVSRVTAKLGSTVRRGQILVELDAAELNARWRQTQAQLLRVQTDLARERKLVQSGATMPVAAEALESQLALVESQSDEARTMVSYTRIAAPFDGVVSQKLVNVGDLATSGMPLLEIEGAGPLDVEVMVPESLARLVVGTDVTVSSNEGNTRETAKVAEVAGASDARTRTVQVKLRLAAKSTMKSGAYVQVEVPGPSSQAIVVPEGAVTRWGQVERVFGFEGGAARLHAVRTGATEGGSVEVLAGLSPGEKVLLLPPSALRDGDPVEAMP